MGNISSRTWFDLLVEIEKDCPDRPCLIFKDGKRSYSEMRQRSQALGESLKERGLKPGDRVGIWAPNRCEWLEVLFATSYLGVPLVPFSTWSTKSELSFLIDDSKVNWIFSISNFGGRDFLKDLNEIQNQGLVPGKFQIIKVGQESEFSVFCTRESKVPGKSAGQPNDVATVLYTSGSSSRPKAVPLRHQSIVENGFNIGERLGLTSEDRVFVPVPLFWSYGSINALPAIFSHGACMVLQELYEPGSALSLIEEQRCTAIYTLPAITNSLLSHSSFSQRAVSTLRTGLTIGTPQDLKNAAESLGVKSICNIYGSTETYGNCTVTPHDWPFELRSKTQGIPLPGTRLRIRNPVSGGISKAGEVGSIEVSGHIIEGYYGESSRHNAKTFSEDGYFLTGDLGSIDEAGRLTFAGRSNEMIKRSGINVSPAEVEEIIQQDVQVASVGVTGKPDNKVDEAIVAFVVPKNKFRFNKESLVSHCKRFLSSYKIPDRIELCDELPLTPTGKLMRRELKEWANKLL